MNDFELLQAIANERGQGAVSDQAFRTFYDLHAPFVMSAMLGEVRAAKQPLDLAEDITGRVFDVAYHKAEQFKLKPGEQNAATIRASVRAWLRKIGVNALNDYLRANGKRLANEIPFGETWQIDQAGEGARQLTSDTASGVTEGAAAEIDSPAHGYKGGDVAAPEELDADALEVEDAASKTRIEAVKKAIDKLTPDQQVVVEIYATHAKFDTGTGRLPEDVLKEQSVRLNKKPDAIRKIRKRALDILESDPDLKALF